MKLEIVSFYSFTSHFWALCPYVGFCESIF